MNAVRGLGQHFRNAVDAALKFFLVDATVADLNVIHTENGSIAKSALSVFFFGTNRNLLHMKNKK